MSDAAEKLPEGQDAPKIEGTDAATQAAQAPEPEASPKKLLDPPVGRSKSLTNARFALAETKRNIWLVSVEQGTTVEQILDGSFWSNVARSLRPGDEIIVRPDDMSWELILHVAGQEPLFAHVVKKSYLDLTPSTPPVHVPSRYKVEHAGSHYKWRVLRDGSPLKDGFETAEIARRYAANHQKAVDR